ncbi:hypothetical protein CJU89_5985 [Yarrowia sp. B02]|nr:hypothetical protein CJU89_5985 [Yarrowia sp. B02]
MERLMKAKARHTSSSGSEKTNARLSTSTHSSVNSQFSYSSYPESTYSTQSTAVSQKPQVVLGDSLIVEKKPEIYDSYGEKHDSDSFQTNNRLSMGSFSSSGSDEPDLNNDFLLQAIRDSATGNASAAKMDFHQSHQGHRTTADSSEKFTGLGYQTEMVYSEPLPALERTVTAETALSAKSKQDFLGSKLRTLKGRFIK